MKKFLLVTFAVLSVAFFGACSDDSPTEPVEKPSDFKSFLSVGNWWEYNTYFRNSNDEPEGEKTLSYKFTVLGKQYYYGREAYTVLNYSDDLGADTLYFAEDENGLYNYGALDYDPDKSLWIKLADYNNESWDIDKTNINNAENGKTYIGTIVTSGKYKGIKKVTSNNVSYDAKSYLRITKYDITSTYVNEKGETVQEHNNRADTVVINLIPGIGIYSIKYDQNVYENGKPTVRRLIDVLQSYEIKSKD